MKKIILLFIFVTTTHSFAQLQKGIIYYGEINALQSGDAKGTDSNAYMVFNKNQSYYVTAKDSLEKAEKMNEEKTYLNDDKGGSIYLGTKVSKQGDQVVYNIAKKTMWSNLFLGKQFYIKEITPKMNWKIEKETKKIGSFICKKATSFFRGRNYIAWFTTEIALPFGPWKLNGLPGIILEAYDTNKHIYWYFKSIEYPTKIKENVKYISTPKGIAFKSFDEFKLFQQEQIDVTIDKQRIAQKRFPNVIFIDPKISEQFIEF
ncbi:GLPGLI family protein [Flavobacterium sp.]|uniref:GLPGLI family protein n=1 Tax=Flavobacterium sp. TaxID=239 RepID=UPI0038FC59E1